MVIGAHVGGVVSLNMRADSTVTAGTISPLSVAMNAPESTTTETKFIDRGLKYFVSETLETNAAFGPYHYKITKSFTRGVHDYESHRTYVHQVISPDGQVRLAPFFDREAASLRLKTLWIQCEFPPADLFETCSFFESELNEILTISHLTGIALGQWSELFQVLNMFFPPHEGNEGLVTHKYKGHSLWCFHHTRSVKPVLNPIWEHELQFPEGVRISPPFSSERYTTFCTFADWVDLGCPPAEAFNLKILCSTFISRLVSVARNHNIEKGSWDALATMERLTRARR